MGSLWGHQDLRATDEFATMECLFHDGMTTLDLKRLRRDGDLIGRVIEVLHTHPEKDYLYFDLVEEIMSWRNFFGPEEWRNFGRRISEEEMVGSIFFPWGEQILESPCPFFPGKRIKQTHFASLEIFSFKGEWLDSIRWQNIFPEFFSRTDALNFADFFEPKTTREPEIRWTLTLRFPVPESENKTLAEQIKMLPPEYEITPVSTQMMNLFLCLQKDLNSPFPPSYFKIARCGKEVAVASNLALKGNPIFKDPELFHPVLGWEKNDGWKERNEKRIKIRATIVPDKEKSEEIVLSASRKSPITHYR